MLSVQVAPQEFGVVDGEEGVIQALEELRSSSQAWESLHWEKFAGKCTPPTSVSVELKVLSEDQGVQVDLAVDASLFHQVASIYVLWGWPAIQDLLEKLRHRPLPNPGIVGLVEGACAILRTRIAQELVALESATTRFAANRWRETVARLRQWRRSLENSAGGASANWRFKDASLWAKVDQHLDTYHDLERKREASESRRAKVGASGANYAPWVNDEKYPDISRAFGDDEKRLIREAAKELEALRQVFPPAVMVAGTTARYFRKGGARYLPAVEYYKDTRLERSSREEKVASLIREIVDATIAQLSELEASLAREGVASFSITAEGMRRGPGETWNKAETAAEAVVARRCLENWNVGHALKRVITLQATQIDAAMAFALSPSRNTVLGMSDLVREYAESAECRDHGRFHVCVARHYLHAIDGVMTALELEEERFRYLYTVINWVAGITAIVAFIGSVVVSGGSTLPVGLATAITFIEAADAAIGFALLALTAADTVAQAETMREQWIRTVAILATDDAASLRNAGQALASLESMGWKVTEQVLVIVLQQRGVKVIDKVAMRAGISSRLQLARRGLELSYLADDIGVVIQDGQVVFSPAWNRT